MTLQLTDRAAEAAEAPRLTFGPGPAQELSHELAQAILWEVWAASPERFGNFTKKAMIRLWGGKSAAPAANGAHRG